MGTCTTPVQYLQPLIVLIKGTSMRLDMSVCFYFHAASINPNLRPVLPHQFLSPVPTTDDSNEAHTNTKERITVQETLKGSDIAAFRLYLLMCLLPSPNTWNTWALE